MAMGLILALTAVAVAPARAAAPDARRPKKLIETGWDHPNTERLRANLEEMEERPFDGVVLRVEGTKPDGKPCPLHWMWTAGAWDRAWFDEAVANLVACTSDRLTDNFVGINANPGDVDWFDDAAWADIVAHWRIAASVAKAGGARGILFDPEPYTRPHAPFTYAAQPGTDRHTFDEYAAKVRERGRQVMRAVADEFPDLVLFSYFLNSVCRRATGHRDPNRLLETMGYGLLPAFVDGWLDAAPPTVTFVDGCEAAYRYNAEREYLEAALAIKGACQELVSPENRATYRAQVQVSFGVYLDAYWNPKDSEWAAWYVDGRGGPRVDRLRANVETALRCADEYVWIYGEKFRWWPTPNGRVRDESWPEALPGCEAALRYARDPVDYARTAIARRRKDGTLENLSKGGDFAKGKKGGRPAGWGAWQAEASEGTFTWDPDAGAEAKGAGRAAGVADGCFIQSIPVQPSERYAVRAVRRIDGRGDAMLRVRWQTAESTWTAQGRDVAVPCLGPRGEWAEMLTAVQVPEGVGRLVVLLLVKGQQGEGDVAWFDDAAVYRLDSPGR
ncbi:MAG: hypothetical protein R6X20_01640 [Phycisphaerae bacterium]